MCSHSSCCTFPNALVTIKAVAGRCVRFLGIGQRVRVGEKIGVKITIESAKPGAG